MMGCCVVCAWCYCYVLCGCVNGASPVKFAFPVLYVCISDAPSICCVWGYIFLRFVSCSLVCDRGHKSK